MFVGRCMGNIVSHCSKRFVLRCMLSHSLPRATYTFPNISFETPDVFLHSKTIIVFETRGRKTVQLRLETLSLSKRDYP